MRLAAFLLLVATFQANANATAQKITIVASDVPLEKVLMNIKKQSGYAFFWKDQLLSSAPRVSVQLKNVSLTEALDACFRNLPLSYKIENNFVYIFQRDAFKTTAPESISPLIAVHGIVTNSYGQPLSRVSVTVKGSDKGVITDALGAYSISVEKGDVLQFSFVGYKTIETVVGDKQEVNVSLSIDAEGLSDVVVVGFGTQKKSDLTGAISTPDLSWSKKTANTDIVQSLKGAVPGLNIGVPTTQGQDIGMSVRGLNSLSGSSQPLIVVDDNIYRGRVVDINPADIESVTILKDASAAAIYGSQAANGVVIFTTKSGGKSDGKLRVHYSGSIAVQTPTELYTPANREQFFEKNRAVWWRQAFLPPNYVEPNPDFNDLSALMTIHQNEGYADGTNTDWKSLAVRTGTINNQFISIERNLKDHKYYLSLGYTDSKGYVTDDNNKRYTIRANIENELVKGLRFGVLANSAVSDYKGSGANLGSIMQMSPLAKGLNDDGSLFIYPDGFLTPLIYQLNPRLNNYLDLNGDFYLKLDETFIKGLQVKLDYNPFYRTHRDFMFNPYDLSEQGSASKLNATSFDQNFNGRINYKQNIGVHSIDGTLAIGAEKRTFESTLASSGSFSRMGVDWNRLQDGSVDRQATTTQAWKETSIYQMLRLQYGLKNIYLLTGTLRRDGFSGFGSSNKIGYFPSVAFAWRFTKDNLVSSLFNWMDDGKLRISYGSNGNRTVGRYETLAKMVLGYDYVFGGDPAMGMSTATMGNDDLKWETTRSLNFGIDFNVLNFRLGGSIDYYISNTVDMLFDVSLPLIGGIGSSLTNLGKMKNHGLEIQLNSTNIRRNKFDWKTDVIFSLNRNRIVSLLGIDANNDGVEDNIITENLFIGQPVNTVYGYNVLGLYQLGDDHIPNNSGPGLYRYEDVNGDGIISPSDRKILGYGDPSFTMGIRNTFNYGPWNLMFFVNTMQGGKSRFWAPITGPTGANIDDNVRKQNYGVEHFQFFWTPSNPNSPFKELFKADPIQNNRYFQRNFVRLQDVSLSYNLPADKIGFFKTSGFSGISIYVSGKNLITWTKWYGQDPEVGSGFLVGHPVLRNYNVGLNISF